MSNAAASRRIPVDPESLPVDPDAFGRRLCAEVELSEGWCLVRGTWDPDYGIRLDEVRPLRAVSDTHVWSWGASVDVRGLSDGDMQDAVDALERVS